MRKLKSADSRYSYQLVAAFLSDHQSHLYTSAFDSPGSSRRCGGRYPVEHPAISDQEFLRTANDSIRIVRIAGDWARVTFTSPDPRHYLGEWSFHREDGPWKAAGHSLVIGRCRCG
jgi:hypothetical protein